MPFFQLNGQVMTEASLKVSCSPMLITESQRTADGTLKTDLVAVKYRFTFTWEVLQSGVIGVEKGRDWLIEQYTAGTAATLKVAKVGGGTNDYTVQFSSYEEEALFNYGTNWYYSVKMGLEEV